jgi:hypothetical protein
LKRKHTLTQRINRLFLLSIPFFLFSCAKQLTETEEVKLPKKKPQELIQVLDSLSQPKPGFFYTKISTTYTDTNQNISFKTSVRMVTDSAINTLITYAKIPIVNAIISTDSVTIVNKRDKCYIRQSLGYIKDNFGIDFNYRNIEELILGMPLDYDTSQKYFVIHDPHNYIVSSHKKRELKRIDKQDKVPQREDIAIQYFIGDDAKSLKGMLIESPEDSTSIRVDYLKRDTVAGYSIPLEVYIRIISPRNDIRIELSYDKVEIDQPQPLIMVIPEGYEECK